MSQLRFVRLPIGLRSRRASSSLRLFVSFSDFSLDLLFLLARTAGRWRTPSEWEAGREGCRARVATVEQTRQGHGCQVPPRPTSSERAHSLSLLLAVRRRRRPSCRINSNALRASSNATENNNKLPTDTRSLHLVPPATFIRAVRHRRPVITAANGFGLPDPAPLQ